MRNNSSHTPTERAATNAERQLAHTRALINQPHVSTDEGQPLCCQNPNVKQNTGQEWRCALSFPEYPYVLLRLNTDGLTQTWATKLRQHTFSASTTLLDHVLPPVRTPTVNLRRPRNLQETPRRPRPWQTPTHQCSGPVPNFSCQAHGMLVHIS